MIEHLQNFGLSKSALLVLLAHLFDVDLLDDRIRLENEIHQKEAYFTYTVRATSDEEGLSKGAFA